MNLVKFTIEEAQPIGINCLKGGAGKKRLHSNLTCTLFSNSQQSIKLNMSLQQSWKEKNDKRTTKDTFSNSWKMFV